MRLALLAILVSCAVALPLSAQTITVFDTVFYSDVHGDRIATIYLPDSSHSNGVGVALGHYWKGTRHTPKCWAESLAANGYTAMAFDYYDFNYRNSICKYPKPVTTFKLAVEFLRRGASRFGVTTGKVVGFGQSQGSIHWGQSMVWDNDDAFFNTDPAVDDHLDAAVLLYGAYDTENHLSTSEFDLNTVFTPYFSESPDLRYTKGNTIANVDNISTPIIMFHSTTDQSIHYLQSVSLHDSLLAHNKRSELHIGAWTRHVFDKVPGPSQFTAEGLVAKDLVLQFLEKHLLLPTAAAPGEEGVPVAYALAQNYPNPFNPSTTIEYALPRAGYATLRVYSVLGEEVAKLVAGDQAAGRFTSTWDASGMPTGVYFYRLTASDYAQTRKMVLMR